MFLFVLFYQKEAKKKLVYSNGRLKDYDLFAS